VLLARYKRLANFRESLWELSGGGTLRCALCGGRVAPHYFKKPSGRRYYHCRFVNRWQERAYEHGKPHNVKELEDLVWGLVSDTLKSSR